MEETDEKAGAAGGGATRESGSAGEEQSRQRAEEDAEMRAEEESAKAMEAEVPHSTGYDDPGQEPPTDSGGGETA